MAQAAVAAGPFADRRRRTANLRGRHAFARDLLDFYGAVLGVQEQAYQEAISARPSAGDLVAYVAEMVVPAVADVSVAAGPARLRDAVAARLETSDPREIVAAWIGGEEQVMVDRFLARASLGPVLEALGPKPQPPASGCAISVTAQAAADLPSSATSRSRAKTSPPAVAFYSARDA